jgi:hypothetical protein
VLEELEIMLPKASESESDEESDADSDGSENPCVDDKGGAKKGGNVGKKVVATGTGGVVSG